MKVTGQQRHFQLFDLHRICTKGRRQKKTSDPARQQHTPGQRAHQQHHQQERNGTQQRELPCARIRQADGSAECGIQAFHAERKQHYQQQQPEGTVPIAPSSRGAEV